MISKLNILIFLNVVLWDLGQCAFTPSADFCSKMSCKKNDHLFCGGKLKHNGYLGTTPKKVELTDNLKTLILDKHNELRNILACGEPKVVNIAGQTFPKPAKMPKVIWSEELEWLADFNGRTCASQHDECMQTPNYKTPGQNLAMRKASSLTPEQFIKKMIPSLFSEYLETPLHVIDKYSTDILKNSVDQNELKKITDAGFKLSHQNGHFTCIAQDKTEAIGCVYYECGPSGKISNSYYLVCNYGYTNMLGAPVYKKSEKSECTNFSKKFCCLCKHPNDTETASTCHKADVKLPDLKTGGGTKILKTFSMNYFLVFLIVCMFINFF